MVHRLWCTGYGAQAMVHGLWCTGYGAGYSPGYGARAMVHRLWCTDYPLCAALGLGLETGMRIRARDRHGISFEVREVLATDLTLTSGQQNSTSVRDRPGWAQVRVQVRVQG